jgi:hypothetical protein
LDEIANTVDITDIDANVTINNYNSRTIINTTTSKMDKKDNNKIEVTATMTSTKTNNTTVMDVDKIVVNNALEEESNGQQYPRQCSVFIVIFILILN